MKELGVWEPYAVKVQTYKTAIEAATMLLRIDDIVSGVSRRDQPRGPAGKKYDTTDGDDVDSEQQLQE